MVTEELAKRLQPFFREIGPSHADLDRLVERCGLAHLDPRYDRDRVGKAERVTTVICGTISYREPASAAWAYVDGLISLVRASDGFNENSPNCPGTSVVEELRHVFGSMGYELTDQGHLRVTRFEGFEDSAAISSALHAYVRRARTGAADLPLVIGSTKELMEATAKHVLHERAQLTNSHSFPVVLGAAFQALGLPSPSWDDASAIFARAAHSGDADKAWNGVVQAIYLLACAVNKFRNVQGTGHGYATEQNPTELQAAVASDAGVTVAGFLLRALEERSTH
jgi:hypothetical protein